MTIFAVGSVVKQSPNDAKRYTARVELVRGRLAIHLANASAWRISSPLADLRAGDALFELENVTGAPFILREALAASRILIISSP